MALKVNQSKTGREGEGVWGCGKGRRAGGGVNWPRMIMMRMKVMTEISTKSYKLWAK